MKFFSFAFSWIGSHKKKAVIIGIILITLIVIFPKKSKEIATVFVKKGTIKQTVSTTGTIQSTNTAALNFQIGGTLVYLGAKKGDYLKPNQVIAALDQKSFRKNLETALRNYSLQRNTFDQTLDNNQNRTSDQAINNAMKRILQNNQYDLEKAVLSVELQDLIIQQSVLISPIGGILTNSNFTNTGVTVATSDKFVISDLSHLVFDMEVDESEIGQITTGKQVILALDAYKDKTIALEISRIDFASHTTSTGGTAFTVETTFPSNPDNKYRIGMNGDADIVIDKKDSVLVIPMSSIFDDSYVYLKTQKGFQKRKIKKGLESDTSVEVILGLKENDIVAREPSQVK